MNPVSDRAPDSMTPAGTLMRLCDSWLWWLEERQDVANGHVNSGADRAREPVLRGGSCLSFGFYRDLQSGAWGSASPAAPAWEASAVLSKWLFYSDEDPSSVTSPHQRRVHTSFTFRYSIHHPFHVGAASENSAASVYR